MTENDFGLDQSAASSAEAAAQQARGDLSVVNLHDRDVPGGRIIGFRIPPSHPILQNGSLLAPLDWFRAMLAAATPPPTPGEGPSPAPLGAEGLREILDGRGVCFGVPAWAINMRKELTLLSKALGHPALEVGEDETFAAAVCREAASRLTAAPQGDGGVGALPTEMVAPADSKWLGYKSELDGREIAVTKNQYGAIRIDCYNPNNAQPNQKIAFTKDGADVMLQLLIDAIGMNYEEAALASSGSAGGNGNG